MLKKLFTTVILLCLVLSSFSFIFVSANELNIDLSESESKISKTSESFSFSVPDFDDNDDYLSVSVDKVDTFLSAEGKPKLPCYTKFYTFPLGTTINDVTVTPTEIKTKELEEKIQPAPRAVERSRISQYSEDELIFEDAGTYSSSELYPNDWYTQKCRVGMYNGVRSLLVTFSLYPVRYSPAENEITYTESMNVEFSYEIPESPVENAEDSYNMVIIGPQKFRLLLMPLVMHKKNIGVNTFFKSTESIFEEQSGRDKPEQIKYFIKETLEENGEDFKYVLLVGGLKGFWDADDREHRNYGAKDWYVPVRYTNIPRSGEIGTPSDLYYSDIYKYDSFSGYEFEDWDSDGDDVFADMKGTTNYLEETDLVPDVYYGRLACRNNLEVMINVKKIILYELTNHRADPWYKTMLLCGGLTFWKGIDGDQLDGEWLCNRSYSHMSSICDTAVKCYVTHNGTNLPRPIPSDIIREWSKGVGFVYMSGHSAPWIWDTHWEDANVDSQANSEWAGSLTIYHAGFMRNRMKLPIVVAGGCHNGMFNVSLVKTSLDGLDGPSTYWTHGFPTFECVSWRLMSIRKGGAIASMGCTGFGLASGGPLSLSAVLEDNTMYNIGVNKTETVGIAHGDAITRYILNDDGIGNSDFYVITIFELFGDPSLRIGGR